MVDGGGGVPSPSMLAVGPRSSVNAASVDSTFGYHEPLRTAEREDRIHVVGLVLRSENTVSSLSWTSALSLVKHQIVAEHQYAPPEGGGRSGC